MTQPMGSPSASDATRVAILRGEIERSRTALQAQLRVLGDTFGERARKAGRVAGLVVAAAVVVAGAGLVGLVRFVSRRVRRRGWF